MMGKTSSLIAATSALFLANCAVTTATLAPGAADVRIVRNETDVASCTAVGNVRQPPDAFVDIRNLTVGVGGNTLFVTQETKSRVNTNDFIEAGVAYRCPN